jgi:hypothetical protein
MTRQEEEEIKKRDWRGLMPSTLANIQVRDVRWRGVCTLAHLNGEAVANEIHGKR